MEPGKEDSLELAKKSAKWIKTREENPGWNKSVGKKKPGGEPSVAPYTPLRSERNWWWWCSRLKRGRETVSRNVSIYLYSSRDYNEFYFSNKELRFSCFFVYLFVVSHEWFDEHFPHYAVQSNRRSYMWATPVIISLSSVETAYGVWRSLGTQYWSEYGTRRQNVNRTMWKIHEELA
jgi:hypothetical protein